MHRLPREPNGEVVIGGREWRVYVVSPRSVHLRDGSHWLEGKCDFEQSAIFISRRLGRDAREETYIHEFLHALLRSSAADEVYKSGAVDELIVVALTPHVHGFVKWHGFQFPEGLYR